MNAPAAVPFAAASAGSHAGAGWARPSGASMPTEALLDFTLAHARARDAVHAGFDVSAIVPASATSVLLQVRSSRARNRKEYLERTDLGECSIRPRAICWRSREASPCRLAIVVGDGLSPAAVNAHAAEVVRHLIPIPRRHAIEIGHTVVATGRAGRAGRRDRRHPQRAHDRHADRRTARPVGPGRSRGLSDLRARPRRTDAERNCLSNIHGAGLATTRPPSGSPGWSARRSPGRSPVSRSRMKAGAQLRAHLREVEPDVATPHLRPIIVCDRSANSARMDRACGAPLDLLPPRRRKFFLCFHGLTQWNRGKQGLMRVTQIELSLDGR